MMSPLKKLKDFPEHKKQKYQASHNHFAFVVFEKMRETIHSKENLCSKVLILRHFIQCKKKISFRRQCFYLPTGFIHMSRIFKSVVTPCSIAVLFWWVLSAWANRPAEVMYCKVENTAIGFSESLVYKAYYNWQFVWIPAGEATFQVRKKGKEIHIKVTGRTYDAYDPFFKVRDYFYSVIDAETMYPKSFVRQVQEGKYTKFDSLVFDHEKSLAISFNGKTKKSALRKIIPLKDCTHDLLSVLYYMRNMDVSRHTPGEFIPTQILFDEKIYPIKVRYAGKEKGLDIDNIGTFSTVKVIPDLITGNVFKDGNKMTVWVSDDGNKLPLLIESPLSVGSAKAILKKYEGLKHPLRAGL